MTRTSKRWIVRAVVGFVGAAALGQPALADGWLRERIRSLCEGSPWSRPAAAPIYVQPAPQMAPYVTPVPTPKVEVPKVEVPKVDVPKIEAPPPVEPRFEPLVSAALGESAVAVAFNPAMFGDLNGHGSVRKAVLIDTRLNGLTAAPIIVVVPPRQVPGVPTTPTTPTNPNQPTAPTTPTTPTTPTQRVVILQFPQLSYASFKIAENESPRPTDRVFVTYNYYDGLPTSPFTPQFDVHRETIGFEKTFLDGSASIGLRVPFIQLSGPENVFNAFNVRDGQFGDVSVIAKYAFYDDRSTGNLISGGLMVTAPTGEDTYMVNGETVHSTLLQPWVGTIWGLSDRVFVQGFSSIVLPSDHRDVTAWFNDIGVGYWLRRGEFDRFFHGIVPTAEVHVGTPLTNRGDGDINRVQFPDYVSLVGGVNFIFWRNSSFGLAAGAPVTGNKPWDFETHVSLNFQF
jgi:hypothetical protein